MTTKRGINSGTLVAVFIYEKTHVHRSHKTRRLIVHYGQLRRETLVVLSSVNVRVAELGQDQFVDER